MSVESVGARVILMPSHLDVFGSRARNWLSAGRACCNELLNGDRQWCLCLATPGGDVARLLPSYRALELHVSSTEEDMEVLLNAVEINMQTIDKERGLDAVLVGQPRYDVLLHGLKRFKDDLQNGSTDSSALGLLGSL